MSRGLGKIQKAILDVLQQDKEPELTTLTILVFHPEMVNEHGEIDFDWTKKPWVTHAEYVTIDRAVRTLERRGMVTMRIIRPRRPYPTIPLNPGQVRFRRVSLVSVDRT